MRTLTLIGLALVTLNCGGDDSSTPPICTNCGDGSGGDGGVVEAGPDVQIPPNCDLTKDVMDSPACVDDGIGVFVDATKGLDTNPGTKASPFKTIGQAIAKAGAKPRVYVCEGTYSEDVSLTQQNAVSILGGLSCADWTYGGKSVFVGKSTLAFHVDGLSKPIVVADLVITSADGAKPGESSIAALVNGSADVAFRRVTLHAGVGAKGKSGTTPSNWTQVSQSDKSIAGTNGAGTSGGPAHACMLCTDGKQSTGAKGGAGTLGPTAGDDGLPALNGKAPKDGVGGAAGCKQGDDGASGADATPAKGAAALGTLGAAGWSAKSGDDATNGGVAQGGGGGGGGSSLGSGGGGGGACGGCGGAGGTGGGGGGGSIALAIVASKVTLFSSTLVAASGGKGGDGAVGQPGQAGGFSGSGASPGCNGGNGGTGGAGGSGGGGAGGVSYGVLYSGTKPTIDDATTAKITVASAVATHGVGGAPGTNDGIDGVATPVAAAP